jgi:hypothetical protein
LDERTRPVSLGSEKNVMLRGMPERLYSRKAHHYDIVRKEYNKSAIWLEAALDLNTAESRIHELASFWPGEFQIIDGQNHQIVERIVSPCDAPERRG